MGNFSIQRNGQWLTAGAAPVVHSLGEHARYQTDLMIYNPGPFDVHVLAGGESVTASDTSMVIIAGEKGAYRKDNATHLSTLSPAGDQAILIFLGEGS